LQEKKELLPKKEGAVKTIKGFYALALCLRYLFFLFILLVFFLHHFHLCLAWVFLNLLVSFVRVAILLTINLERLKGKSFINQFKRQKIAIIF